MYTSLGATFVFLLPLFKFSPMGYPSHEWKLSAPPINSKVIAPGKLLANNTKRADKQHPLPLLPSECKESKGAHPLAVDAPLLKLIDNQKKIAGTRELKEHYVAKVKSAHAFNLTALPSDGDQSSQIGSFIGFSGGEITKLPHCRYCKEPNLHSKAYKNLARWNYQSQKEYMAGRKLQGYQEAYYHLCLGRQKYTTYHAQKIVQIATLKSISAKRLFVVANLTLVMESCKTINLQPSSDQWGLSSRAAYTMNHEGGNLRAHDLLKL